MNLPTTTPNDRDLAWYIKECEWMQTELGKLKTENEIMRNRLNSLVSNNNKQTDEYICVDREHGLWKRKEPKEPNVNADRLALALSLEIIQGLERENAALRADKERLEWLLTGDGGFWVNWMYEKDEWTPELKASRDAIDACRNRRIGNGRQP